VPPGVPGKSPVQEAPFVSWEGTAGSRFCRAASLPLFPKKIKREVLLVEEALQALGALVGNLGFPIAVCVFLLVRIEGRLSELAASIAELARAVEAGRK
jgi:hypothetical protein